MDQLKRLPEAGEIESKLQTMNVEYNTANYQKVPSSRRTGSASSNTDSVLTVDKKPKRPSGYKIRFKKPQRPALIPLLSREITIPAPAEPPAPKKEYEEIMDVHALQIFLIRNGEVITQTPEYQSFQRIATEHWKMVELYLTRLQTFAKMLNVFFPLKKDKNFKSEWKQASLPN